MPATQQQATRAPRQARRQTSIEATLRVTKTELSSRDEAWIDSLTPEQLLVECRKREIELPANGGNVITRRARLRKHVLEHGRTIKTKVQKPPVEPLTGTAQEEQAQAVPPPVQEPVMTQKPIPSGPDAGQKQRTAAQPPAPPPPQGGKPDKKQPPAPPAPPAPPTQARPQDLDAPRPRWFWPALAAIIALGIIGVLLVEATRSKGQDNSTADIVNAFSTIQGKTTTTAGASPTNAGATPTQAAADTTHRQQPASADWALNKCAWLRNNLPQDTKTIQSLGAKSAGVDPKRIRPTRFRCSATTNDGVFDGYVIMGPNEGFLGTFTVSVPDHGRVDSYATSCGARYTVGPRPIAVGSPNKCDDTWAIDSGSVTALSATVYAFNDENPPIGGSSAQPSSKSITDNGQGQCMLGKDLAAQMGWTLVQPQPDSVGKFGGAQVEIKTDATLPQGWEATTAGPSLKGGDLLTPGFYSVYPPQGACRTKLGVSN